nr:hypothetical protein HAGR004_01490 [Bdellovibrio sp. HAGR004]
MKSDKAETLWLSAVEIIRHSPAPMSALNFETTLGLLFILLEIDLTTELLAISYFAACEGDSFSFFLDRLEYERTKSA